MESIKSQRNKTCFCQCLTVNISGRLFFTATDMDVHKLSKGILHVIVIAKLDYQS